MSPTPRRLIQGLARRRLLLLTTTFATITALNPVAPAAGLARGGFAGGAAPTGAGAGNGVTGPGSPGTPGSASNPTQAQMQTAQSLQDLQAAARAILAQQGAQAAAHAAALAAGANNLGAGLPNVPNGLGPGGLQVAPGVGADSALWQNAALPTQSTANGQTLVTIQQNAQKAILTWSQFNVGKDTTVYFNQSGGTAADGSNSWIALNRIVDPSGIPSQILGQIKAEGTVYLINRNGVIFGGSSQVNTHSLLVSSLPFLGTPYGADDLTPGTQAYDDAVAHSNAEFLTQGIGAVTGGATALGGRPAFDTDNPADPGNSAQLTTAQVASLGAVVVQAGALIQTGNLGYALLAAPNVTNAGSIVTPNGQAILAAGANVYLTPQTTGLFTVGIGLTDDLTHGTAFTATNAGLIQATTGNITIDGTFVNQNGVAEVTTGITRPGTMTFSAGDGASNSTSGVFRSGPVSFGSGSVTAILPEEDGQTTTSSTAADQSFVPGSISINGFSVTFQDNSLLEAPGATVSATAFANLNNGGHADADTSVGGRIYIGNNTTIDVAGLDDVQRSASDVVVKIGPITANDVADSPLQRNGWLISQTVYVDSTRSGVRADGEAWIGSPLLDAQGYVDEIPRTIDEMLVNGGTLKLHGGELIAQPGSLLDVQGGYTHYLGGYVTTTALLGANGQIYDIANIDPNEPIVGFAGQFVIDHPHWGVSETYSSPLLSRNRTRYESDYVQGGNGGTIDTLVTNGVSTFLGNIGPTGATILDGAIQAGSVAGRHQVADGSLPSGGSFLIDDKTLGDVTAIPPSEFLTIAAQGTQTSDIAAGFGADTPINTAAMVALDPHDPANLTDHVILSGPMLDAAGFSNLNFTEQTGTVTIAPGGALTVRPGGSITITAGGIRIDDNLTAPGGMISATSNTTTTLIPNPSNPFNPTPDIEPGDIEVGDGVVVSAAGRWTNDSGLGLDGQAGPGDINGGTITFTTTEISGGSPVVDFTGAIRLGMGSVLDVSGGGYVNANGVLLTANGVPQGKGGSITLQTYVPADGGVAEYGTSSGPAIPSSLPDRGQLVLDGVLRGYGFAGGGTLTLQTTGFQIGGDPASAPAYALWLPADFFFAQGFSAYSLNALYDIAIAPGTAVTVAQRTFVPNLNALLAAPTGTSLYGNGVAAPDGTLVSLGTLDATRRQPTSLSLSSDAYLDWENYPGVGNILQIGEGASITVGAGGSVSLTSGGSIVDLGTITAPGGSISLALNPLTHSPGNPGTTVPGSATPGQGEIWLGADSVLDASGTVLIDPLAKAVGLAVPRTGKVLDGGTISVEAGNGYLVAQPGSRIDASGTSATLDILQSAGGLGGSLYLPTLVWSDGGSIALGGAQGLLYDGTLSARGGAPGAAGGTLALNSAGASVRGIGGSGVIQASGIILQQSGDFVPAGLQPGQAVTVGTAGVERFAVDRLDGSGIGTLVVGSDALATAEAGLGGAGSVLNYNAMAIGFAGPVDLNLEREIALSATSYVSLAAGAADFTGSGPTSPTTVTIAAPYVEIAGGFSGTPPTAVAGGSLVVNAGSFLDLVANVALKNFGTATFASGSDIRFSDLGGTGELLTGGNLAFTAAQLYPATANGFVIAAVGAGGASTDIAINGVPGASPLPPLSAGGSLLFDATTIEQNGTVRAPDGSIVLGVSDATGQQAQFLNLPLVVSNQVTLGSGSVTSVSLDGLTVPYGSTVDGLNWTYGNYSFGDFDKPAAVTAPPAKSISLGGNNLAIDPGSTVDLSGGGTVEASEWVAGTGGTRNLLLQSTISLANGGVASHIPLYADQRPVYAILPGYDGPVAPVDFSMEPSGTAVGERVYLSGIPGLAAGYYTLLPGQYAVLPGAYRVVQQTGTVDVLPSQNSTLLDGTHIVSGYFSNGLDGSRDARTTSFTVQSAATWGQYSSYTLTDADSYFTQLAAKNGTATPRLPEDAGQLALAANNTLTLGGAIVTAAPGRGAQVDVASDKIQVVGQGEAALAGYLQLDASDLVALGAESLLLGGVRTANADGSETVAVSATSLVVSNDAAHPLTGPEVILVTKADPSDPTGLLVESGSVIEAQGNASGAPAPLAFGRNADATTGATALSGDGALLAVSNGGILSLTRNDLPGSAQGLLTVQNGVTLSGGAGLTLDASGNTVVDPGAVLSGGAIAADSGHITFVSDPALGAGASGLVVGPGTLAQFANAARVLLRSYNDIDFEGNVGIDVANALTLSAGVFTDGVLGNAGDVSVHAGTVTLSNDLSAPLPAAPAAGTAVLALSGNEIDFGSSGSTATSGVGFSGFGSVTATAANGIVVQSASTFDFGAMPVTFTAPQVVAGSGANATLKTTGSLVLAGAAPGGATSADGALGGAFKLIAGSIQADTVVRARSGNVTLEATTGDLALGADATVSGAGTRIPFFDIFAFAPAGKVNLIADAGSIAVAAGATLDVSGAAGGGNAGSLTLSAPTGTVDLAGAILGGAAAGFQGGSFTLDTGGAADLNGLAAVLASSGVTHLISIHTRAGNLVLDAGETLAASTVVLTADGVDSVTNLPGMADGNVNISGTIDASGAAGGLISLSGRSGIDLEGTLNAIGTDPTQLGGTVLIGVGAVADGNYNPAYGYEEVVRSGSGKIVLGTNAAIHVDGGSATTLANDGLTGGTVSLRAPILDDGTVNVEVDMTNPQTQITGARSVSLEAYAVWSTTDTTTGAQHFDSFVDPAGWYDASGHLLAGTFTPQDGSAAITYTPGSMTDAQLADALANDFFTPDAANPDHTGFYGTTLMQFVQSPNLNLGTTFANVPGFHATPGVELDNPSSSINSGDITVLTDWNLDAGSDPSSLSYRYNGQAPVITFRASGNVKVKASLSDGFWEFSVPVSGVGVPTSTLASVNGTESNMADSALSNWGVDPAALAALGVFDANGDVYFGLPHDFTGSGENSTEVNQYYGLYQLYLSTLAANDPNIGDNALLVFFGLLQQGGLWTVDGSQSWPAPPAPTRDGDYQNYVVQWTAYYQSHYADIMGNFTVAPDFTPLQPPPTTLDLLTGPTLTDNGPSPSRNATNPLPLASAALAGGASSSFRIVAGADLASADPLAVRAGAAADVTLDGHLAWQDPATGHTVAVPTMVRTGTGSISIAAAQDVALLDTQVPGVIYTGGEPAPGTNASGSVKTVSLTTNKQDPTATYLEILALDPINPTGAGDITIQAGRDIDGIELIYADMPTRGNPGTIIGQFWAPWMTTSNPHDNTNLSLSSAINFANFDQGILSAGGNVTISAGNDIRDLSVSLPTTWNQGPNGSIVTYGSGNLAVSAGGDILSGAYFVARGTGTISAGGRIGSDLTYAGEDNFGGFSLQTPLSTLLGLQDTVMTVTARQGADLGGVFDPSDIGMPGGVANADLQTYSARSSLSVVTTGGDAKLGTMSLYELFNYGGNGVKVAPVAIVLPASLSLTSVTGGITIAESGGLYPSTSGQLTLLADQDVRFYNGLYITSGGSSESQYFGLIDFDPSLLPSPLHQLSNNSGEITTVDYVNPSAAPISGEAIGTSRFQHTVVRDSADPARIYSLEGDIVDGEDNPVGGTPARALWIVPNKPAFVEAGRDIVNLAFIGQNFDASDVTRVVAGRDLYDPAIAPGAPTQPDGVDWRLAPAIELQGPGYLDVEAGRDIGPLTTALDAADSSLSLLPTESQLTGIETIGDLFNGKLGTQGANLTVLFGVAKGIDDTGFAAAYLAPGAVLPDGVPDRRADVIDYVRQIQQDDLKRSGGSGAVAPLTLDQAWAAFQALPQYRQQAFVDSEFFAILRQVGDDYNEQASPFFHEYARGYQAVNTLFPASFGYTANGLGGGLNGAKDLVPTGTLDMRSSTIQTDEGGDVNILGPGGRVLVGSASAPPEIVSFGRVTAGPNQMGILTLETGDVNIFSDDSLLLAQSRVFTEQGGDMVIWNSNGDIDAGDGVKTSSDVPPTRYKNDLDGDFTVDAKSLVTGAGIATLQTKPNSPSGDIVLVAPRGTVDAGAAGIRVSGNLAIAAARVANAFNITVQGTSSGVPTAATVDVSGLSSANNAAGALDAAMVLPTRSSGDIRVEVVGFGGGNGSN